MEIASKYSNEVVLSFDVTYDEFKTSSVYQRVRSGCVGREIEIKCIPSSLIESLLNTVWKVTHDRYMGRKFTFSRTVTSAAIAKAYTRLHSHIAHIDPMYMPYMYIGADGDTPYGRVYQIMEKSRLCSQLGPSSLIRAMNTLKDCQDDISVNALDTNNLIVSVNFPSYGGETGIVADTRNITQKMGATHRSKQVSVHPVHTPSPITDTTNSLRR